MRILKRAPLILSLMLALLGGALLLSPGPTRAQFVDRLVRPCAVGGGSGLVQVTTTNILLNPCPSGSVTINGVAINPSGGLTCAGCTANTLTKYNGINLANSRVTDDGTTVTATSRTVNIGDFTNNQTKLGLIDASRFAFMYAGNAGPAGILELTGGAGGATVTLAGQGPAGNDASLTMSGITHTLQLIAGNTGGDITLDAANDRLTISTSIIRVSATVTASGTTGAQTINKSAGSVNFAAAATSLVVTNNTVTASSIILCTVGTNDTTLKSVQCVAAAGSFTMFGNAAATAETRVNFWVITPN